MYDRKIERSFKKAELSFPSLKVEEIFKTSRHRKKKYKLKYKFVSYRVLGGVLFTRVVLDKVVFQ